MARPTKCTPELTTKFAKLIEEDGLHRKDAAALCGVSEFQASRWFNRGASSAGGPYRRFYLAVTEAEAKFKHAAHLQLKAGGPKTAQWLLSRRFPGDYGRKDNVVETNAHDEAANNAALRKLFLEKLDRLLPEKVEPETPGAIE